MTKKLRVILFFGLLTAFFTAGAQSINYQQQYLNGKELFRKGEYALARETFKPLIAKNAANPFSEYATFYAALSAYHDGYPAAGRDLLLQARERFPKWSKMEEINFWLGKIYFESEDTYLALNALKNIKNKDLAQTANAMKYHFLYKNHDVFELKSFYKDYSSDAILGRVLAEKISAQPIADQDTDMLDKLISRFDLNPDEFRLSPVTETEYKDTYRIAVMLPFMVEDLSSSSRKRPNQFVLDLYQGIRMAFDTLNSEEQSFEVYAYDTRRDSITTQRILKQEELKGMDLIIGPLYPQPSRLVNQFALDHKINMVNPLSNSVEFATNNPYVFLFNPSLVTIGEVAAQYSLENFGKEPGIVIFGDSRNDRILAESYADAYTAEGGRLLMVREVEKNNTQDILDILLAKGTDIRDITDENRNNLLSIPKDSLSHIFVASDNSLIFSKVVSAVDTRGDDVKIVGSAGWLDIPVVKYEVFERLKAHFYAPSYYLSNSAKYRAFRDNYLNKHREAPTDYSAKGYELGLFFGNNLKKYGKYPQASWNKDETLPGYFLPEYSFTNKQDNQLVPFLHFGEEGGLKQVFRERKEINKK